jgi:hypothetical protein
MDAAELIDLVSTGSNAALVAVLGSDPTWNVAADWGLAGWKAVRVPVGIKFQRYVNGLICETVVIVHGGGEERARHQGLLRRSLVPAHVAVVEREDRPHNRLARRALFPQVGRDE